MHCISWLDQSILEEGFVDFPIIPFNVTYFKYIRIPMVFRYHQIWLHIFRCKWIDLGESTCCKRIPIDSALYTALYTATVWSKRKNKKRLQNYFPRRHHLSFHEVLLRSFDWAVNRESYESRFFVCWKNCQMQFIFPEGFAFFHHWVQDYQYHFCWHRREFWDFNLSHRYNTS